MSIIKKIFYTNTTNPLHESVIRKRKNKCTPVMQLIKASNCGGSLTKITFLEDIDIPENRSDEVKPAFVMAIENILSFSGGNGLKYIFRFLKRETKNIKRKRLPETHLYNGDEDDFCCIVNYMSRMRRLVLYHFLVP